MTSEYTMNDIQDTKSSSGEEASLVNRERRVSLKTAVKLRSAIIVISWCTVVVLGTLGVATLVVAFTSSSSAALAFALDAILDVLSSLVVLWRFSGESGNLYSKKKEGMACTVLGTLFLLSSMCIAVRSIYSLVNDEHPIVEVAMFYLYLANGLVCTVLMVGKVYIGWKLESRSILTDAVNSFIGGMLAFASLVGDIVYQRYVPAWMVDPIAGIVCAVLLTAYGIWIIIISVQDYREGCREQCLHDES